MWLWRPADLLAGRAFLQNGGNCCCALESPWAAFLASSSARSLPAIPSCPGVHLSSISMPDSKNIRELPWSRVKLNPARDLPGIPNVNLIHDEPIVFQVIGLHIA